MSANARFRSTSGTCADPLSPVHLLQGPQSLVEARGPSRVHEAIEKNAADVALAMCASPGLAPEEVHGGDAVQSARGARTAGTARYNGRVTIDIGAHRTKTVGRRRPARGGLIAAAPLLDLVIELRRDRPFMPKGVYRFGTFEESAAWSLQMMARPKPDHRG